MNSFDIISNFERESSYKKNHFGFLFYSLIRVYKPKNCIEFGVLNGYSTVSISCGLKDNGFGKLNAVDLFEDYEYKNNTFQEASKIIAKYDLNKYTSLIRDDVYSFSEKIENNSIDFIHLDISNDGDKISKFINKLYPKMKKDCLFIFEGGSKNRDSCEWMKKYNKTSINNIIKNQDFLRKFNFLVAEPIPSLTICIKR